MSKLSKKQQKKLLKSLRLTLATSMLATPVITNASATVAYAQEHKEQQEPTVDSSVNAVKEEVNKVDTQNTEESTPVAAEEAEGKEEPKKEVVEKDAPTESSTKQDVETSKTTEKSEPSADSTTKEKKGVQNRKEYEDHQITWNEFSKTLEITANQTDVNDVATHMKEDFSHVIGAVDVLVLHGSFDDTPVSFSNYNSISGKHVTGDITKLAPKLFVQTTDIQSVALPNVSTFHGDEFNVVSTIEEVEVGMKAEDTLGTVKEVFSASAASIKKLKVNNITDAGDFDYNTVPFKNVETVDLPVATSIGESAFRDTQLTNVNLPAARSIGYEAFLGTQLTSVDLPAATSIGESAFWGTPLTSVNLPVATSIKLSAFDEVDGIEEVEVGMKAEDTLEKVKSVFSNSADLIKKLKVNNIKDTGDIGDTVPFKNVETIALPSATSIGESAFKGTPLTSVDLPVATSIGESAFSGTQLTSVDLPVATSIGDYAFSGTPLTSVDLPVATSIGESAFRDTQLTNVNLPAARSIGYEAFYDTPLTSVDLPVATSIGEAAFRHVPLTSVNLPVATSIGDYAFSSTQLTSVDLPVATSIGESAFSGTQLTSVDLPVATSIGEYAFRHVPLTSVNLPVATSIHKDAFWNVDSIEEVEVGMKAEDTLEKVKSVFSNSADSIKKLKVNNIKDTGDIGDTVPFKNVETIALPSATSIGVNAFWATALTSVELPVATSIGKDAFKGTPLTSVNLPRALSIGDGAFFDTALTSVELPVATSIGDYAFYDTALTSVELPVATSIGDYAFYDTALTSVELPAATSIGEYAFYDTALTSVDLPAATSIGEYAFRYVPLTSVNLPVATSIHKTAFWNVDSIEEVEVGMKAEDTLEKVKSVFSNSANSIKKLKVNNIKNTGDFDNPTVPFKYLENIDLPNAEVIGELAFYDTSLSKVNIPKVQRIDNWAFNATNIQFLNLPSLETLSEKAFSESKIDYVFFPGNVANNVKASFDAAPTVIGVGIKTDDVVYNLNEGAKKTLTFNDVVLNSQEVAKKEMQLQGVFTKGEEEYKGNPLDYKITATADSAGEYQGRIVLIDSKDAITETGVTRKFNVNVKEEVKAPKVNPVTDRDEVITGNGMKGAEVSAKVNGKEIGKGKVDEEGNFEIKIAKQKADTKISVTQTVDGETGPATEVVVSHKEEVKAPKVNPVTDRDEVITGNGMKGAEVSAKVNGKEIGKGKVDEEGNFEIKIAKQKADTKISVTQTVDGETGPATEVVVSHKEEVKAPKVNPVTDRDEVITGNGMKGAEVSAKVNGKEIGKGKVDEEGNFEIKIAKQKADTKISVTQTVDGETGPATEVVVSHKEEVKAPKVNPVTDRDEVITGNGMKGAEVSAKVAGKEIGKGKVDEEGNFEIKIAKQKADTKISVTQTVDGETGPATEVVVSHKEEVKAPKVNPVTDRDEVITGNGMKGAEVSAKVAGKEIGKGKVDEEGNFEIKIAKQKADTKISVTQTVDGETGPATEVVVSPAKSLVTHVFKKGYWESYGLILNGQVKMDGLDLSKKDSVVKTLELVDESGKVAAAISAVNTNWYTPGQYDGYQATLSAKTIAAVQSGAYKLQVSVVVGNGEATIVPITIDSRNMFGIQDYQDAFLDIPTNNIGLKTIETMSKDGQAMVKVTTPDKPIMGLISEGQAKNGRFVNGYVLNTDYDFSQKHKKNVVIEDKSGKVVKELKNIHTWDLTSWNLGIVGLDMKSGFQVIIPNEYQNTSLYQYKLQVVTGEEEALQLEVDLDKII
ncbi:leucine-rich repeat protein [Enterococcus sp. AZ029]|uniref:leucine-rich repeat protein n=1 Tax=Enterococcus sp. AZ029 TaxID=2774841 RepID=UPI003F1E637E